MAETWVNYWHIGKNGSLVKTGKIPKENIIYIYETAERPAPEISHHTFYCPYSGETRTLNATCDKDRAVKRREIVKELLTNNKVRKGM